MRRLTCPKASASVEALLKTLASDWRHNKLVHRVIESAERELVAYRTGEREMACLQRAAAYLTCALELYLQQSEKRNGVARFSAEEQHARMRQARAEEKAEEASA
jgi:hypothetical protein